MSKARRVKKAKKRAEAVHKKKLRDALRQVNERYGNALRRLAE